MKSLKCSKAKFCINSSMTSIFMYGKNKKSFDSFQVNELALFVSDTDSIVYFFDLHIELTPSPSARYHLSIDAMGEDVPILSNNIHRREREKRGLI
jgi:hypothetical protein